MKLFVGNIPATATDQEIMAHFGRYGIESIKTVKDQETGRNKPFCFAYVSDQNAAKTIQELHNTEFMGKTIMVALSDRTGRKSLLPQRDSWKYKHIAFSNR
jgi:RNA recognition motif-containing protein